MVVTALLSASGGGSFTRDETWPRGKNGDRSPVGREWCTGGDVERPLTSRDDGDHNSSVLAVADDQLSFDVRPAD